MRSCKVVAALIMAGLLAACGSPTTDDADNTALDTLLSSPTGEVQDSAPDASTSSTDAASAGPTASTSTSRPSAGGTTTGSNPGATSGSSSGPGTTSASASTIAGSATTADTTTTSATPPGTGGGPTTTTQATTTSRGSTTTPTTSAPQPQQITIGAILEPWAYGEPRTINASATSRLAIDFRATGACMVENPALGVIRATDVGECRVTASQGGSADWQPAPPVTRSVTIAKAKPVISGIADSRTEHRRVPFSIPLTASTSSGATVGYRTLADDLGEHYCTIAGTNLEVPLTGGVLPRTCIVEAFVDASRLYDAASVRARFTIDPTIVRFTGHTVGAAPEGSTSVSVSVSLNLAWSVVVETADAAGGVCGTAPDRLVGAATYTFTVAFLAPLTSAAPCVITVRTDTIDASHTSDSITITLPTP
ncbi:MAG: hypothetical protein AB7Q42_23760 [Acidimicrobiia bacterium]